MTTENTQAGVEVATAVATSTFASRILTSAAAAMNRNVSLGTVVTAGVVGAVVVTGASYVIRRIKVSRTAKKQKQ